MIIGDVIKRNAWLFGDRTGLVFEDRRFTHRELAQRCYRAANALLDRGVERADRVAVLARNCSEVIELIGAGDLSGFMTLVLNHRLTVRELSDICTDAEPAALVFEADFAEAAEALNSAFPSIRHLICIGAAADGAEDYETVLAAASDAEPAMRAAPDDVASLVYTSGTTGHPKGVMMHHTALLRGAMANILEVREKDPSVGLIVMPLFHVGARVLVIGYVLLGGTVVLHRAFDPAETLRTIEREKVTSTHLAPAMLQRILDLPDRADFDTSSLQSIRYASAPMPVPLLRRCIEGFGPIMNQTYGMTECLGVTILKAHDHVLEGSEKETRRLASAGQPTLGVELQIVRDDGEIARAGEIGEVLIRSDGIMKGYWNNPEATAEALRDGWMHTLDVGRLDEDGFLYILDRKKDMIVSGGENIYSWEVEEALRHHPAVDEVAVIGVPDRDWGEAVKACVVLKDGETVGEDDLIEHCRTLIASYKKPRSIDFRESLPRMFNGKLDKKSLRAQYWAGQERQVS